MPYTNRYSCFYERTNFWFGLCWFKCKVSPPIESNTVNVFENRFNYVYEFILYTCYIWCTGVTCCLGYHGCCGKCTTFLSLQSWFSCMIILLSGRTMTMMSIVDGLHAPRTVHTVARAAGVQISSWSIPILIHWRVAGCRCSNHCSHMTLWRISDADISGISAVKKQIIIVFSLFQGYQYICCNTFFVILREYA